MDDMNDSGSRELKSLDALNRLGKWMILTIYMSLAQASKCYEWIRVVDEMNDTRS